MSGDEPGYVPPDHRTTAEFGVPGKAAGPETTASGAASPGAGTDATVTDGPLDANATVHDERAVLFGTPAGAPADDPEETSPEETSPEEPGEAGAAAAAAPVTVTDVPAEPFARSAMPTPVYAQPPAPGQAPEPAPGQGPWTERSGPAAGDAPVFAAPQGPPPTGPSGTGPSGTGSPGAGRRVLLAGAIGLAVLLVTGAAAVLLLTRGGPDEKEGSAAPSAPATGSTEPTGAPTPGEAPAAPSPSGGPVSQPPDAQPPSPAPVPAAPLGPVLKGKGITYQLVQRDPGYFEGRMVITNRTDKPMKAWKITFRAPRADVKNIWGARLVRGGEKVEIQNLEGVPAIPPGGTWAVQFGAAGSASTPKGCRLNGRACGF